MTTDSLLGGEAPAADAKDDAAPAAADTAEVKAPVEGAAPEGEAPAGDAPKADEVKGEPQGAPEKYEWQAPEGVALDTEVLGEFESYARELNLPQDKAQAAVDLGVRMLDKWQQSLVEQHNATRAQWAEEAKADKELGGDKFNENLAIANTALKAVGGQELIDLLVQTGLCNNVHVIRAFHRVGTQVNPDQFVGGNKGASKPDLASRLYANSMGKK